MEKIIRVNRRKGFPLQMSKLHWMSLLNTYDAVRARKLTTPEMDEAVKLIPDFRSPEDEVRLAIQGKQAPNSIGVVVSHINGSKTIRFRARHVDGMSQLLRIAVHQALHGQAYEAFWNRLERLNAISELDLLADAGR